MEDFCRWLLLSLVTFVKTLGAAIDDDYDLQVWFGAFCVSLLLMFSGKVGYYLTSRVDEAELFAKEKISYSYVREVPQNAKYEEVTFKTPNLHNLLKLYKITEITTIKEEESK